MKQLSKILFAITSFILLTCPSCQPTERQNDRIKIGHNPQKALPYNYTISNETTTEMEVDGKDVINYSKSDINLDCTYGRDSLGNNLISIRYNTLKLETENNGNVQILDAANALNSINPLEKMLGKVKNAKLKVVLHPNGQLKEIIGYKELGEEILAGFDPADIQGKEQARKQWESSVGNQLVVNTLNQFFRQFPDSTIKVGSQWKSSTTNNEIIPMTINSTFTLESVEDDVAEILSSSKITSDNKKQNLLNVAVKELIGDEKGNIRLDLKTGLTKSSVSESEIQGTIETMGRQVPIRIENKITIVSTSQ